MGAPILQGPFDIPEVPDFIPRRLKPWLFILFVIIIQFSGGIYLALASDMAGTTQLMREDVLMAGYAQLVGMTMNFAVMFRIKFRFPCRDALLVSGAVLIAANLICSATENVVVLTAACFVAGWFRMQATFACNSAIQLWLTPVRDMSIFFCYVYLVVDGAIQLSGLAAVYTAWFSTWETFSAVISASLLLMMLMTLLLVRRRPGPMFIPLLGIDWIGSVLWSVTFLCYTFVAVYGDWYDWLDSEEICFAIMLGGATLLVNLWRATFLRHPYISFRAMTNRNVVRAAVIYLVFFFLLGTEHVFEHTYAASVLGFDETNLADLNWYVFAGILAGVAFTYLTFALRRWRYKTMTAIAFSLAGVYLAWFYFTIDYGVEKEMLFIPLFSRGMASVIISIVFLTSILQGGLPFMVFPQALTVNSFFCAVAGATLGPAVIGEWLQHAVARNAANLSAALTAFNPSVAGKNPGELVQTVSQQAMLVSMKEIYGWLLTACVVCVVIIALSYSPLRPSAIFPKWSTIRRVLRSFVRKRERAERLSRQNS